MDTEYTVKINGRTIDADRFGWDRCHKIYLITTDKGFDDMVEYGYYLYSVENLQECWDLSCNLRFINDADTLESYVSQMDENEPRIQVWKTVEVV